MFSCCTKQYIEHPTCQRFVEVSDKYDFKMHYIRTDTLFPMGRIANVICGDSVNILRNYKSPITGCQNIGYQQFRYIVGMQ
jgi:hypothetical protein